MQISQRICELIKIPDVLTKYGIPPGLRGRTQCPLHNGKDRNFCYTDEVFHCFVCGAKGNAVSLVAQMFNITYPQAITRLKNDFMLRISNREPDYREKIQLREAEKRRRETLLGKERGRVMYNKLLAARRFLYREYGDGESRVRYLDRMLDRFADNLGGLAGWEVDIDNLIARLKECAKGGE